jgi:hypothetical protein
MQDLHGTGGIQREENSFLPHNDLKFKEETVKYYIWGIALRI